MTTVCVLCDQPWDGRVLSALPETSPLSSSETTALYTAMLKDVCRAVEASGGDLLVNYRPDEGENAAEVRAVVRGVLDDPDAARFERQVGETFSGRAGNTATHLLEQEGAGSVAIVEPSALFLSRQGIDAAAMKFRRTPVVLGPSTGGRVYYAGFTATIDFSDAYASPAVETLTDRGRAAGHEVDFLPMQPVIETGGDLADALAVIRARQRADLSVPEHTAAVLDDYGLAVGEGTGEVELTR